MPLSVGTAPPSFEPSAAATSPSSMPRAGSVGELSLLARTCPTPVARNVSSIGAGVARRSSRLSRSRAVRRRDTWLRSRKVSGSRSRAMGSMELTRFVACSVDLRSPPRPACSRSGRGNSRPPAVSSSGCGSSDFSLLSTPSSATSGSTSSRSTSTSSAGIFATAVGGSALSKP